jgi:hypothetical protein
VKGIAVCLSLLLAAGPAFAAPETSKQVSNKMEASMVLEGEIEVDAQGLVQGYTLDRSEKLTARLREFVDANIRRWRFEPALVGGKPTAVRNSMGLQLILATQDDGNFRIELRETNFYRARMDKDLADAEVVRVNMRAPMYPAQAASAGVEAEVYLALRIGRDGSVVDVAVEQVNMKSMTPTDDTLRWRKMFAANAVGRRASGPSGPRARARMPATNPGPSVCRSTTHLARKTNTASGCPTSRGRASRCHGLPTGSLARRRLWPPEACTRWAMIRAGCAWSRRRKPTAEVVAAHTTIGRRRPGFQKKTKAGRAGLRCARSGGTDPSVACLLFDLLA